MKRTLIVILLTLLLVATLCLAACGEDGKDGADGKSAYEIWLDAGHEGTLADFLDWMQGVEKTEGSEGLHYYPLSDGTYAVSVGDALYMEEIVIPTQYKGKDVTAIAKSGFCECESLVKITIPASVTSIGNYAFRDCSSLTSITIPSNVISIGQYAFRDCNSLTVFCESISKPDGWNSEWNSTNCPVVWDCDNNAVLIDGLRYALKDGNATVARQPIDVSGAVTIPQSVTYKGEIYPVTIIDSKAFYNCGSLASITIPQSVTNIGDSVFYNCVGLTEIYYNAANAAVSYSNNNIFYNAGKNGSGITVTIGKDVQTIPAYLFYPYYNTDYYSYYSPKINTVVFEEGGNCTSIGEYAFHYCSSLTSIAIPASVTSIGSSAFSNCSSLTSIIIPSCVTSIGNYAFSGCSSLSSITIPGSVTSIGEYAFHYCSSLTSITIPVSITSIGQYAFDGCSSLTIYCEAPSKPSGWHGDWNYSNRPVKWRYNNITTDDTYNYVVHDNKVFLTAYKGSSTNVIVPNKIDGMDVVNIGSIFCGTSITIPDSITSILSSAFSGCSSLKTVTFAENSQWTSIGEYAFSNCSSLTSITIPDNVTSISPGAFYNCYSIKSITIPDSVTSIGEYAFSGCNSLTIYCEAANKPSGWNNDWNGSSCPVVWDCNNQ